MITMLQLKKFTFNAFAENTYIVYDHTKTCVIVDPGCYDKEEERELTAFISANNLQVSAIVNTHCHIDHVLGNTFAKQTFRAPLWIPPLEEPLLRAVVTYASNYGFHRYADVQPDGFIDISKPFRVGEQNLQVLFVPGHSPGHVAFYHAESKLLVGGDVLFENSIGRTDLPGGDHQTLINSIHQKFFTLPDDVTVYCGHGDETSIGFEKRTNPFCALTNQ